MSRKAFTVAVVATTIAWSIGLSALLAPLSASAVASGTLVKASLPAVYYVGSDMKRYVFPNEKTYKTWYSDFSSVQTITDAELAALAIGGNVTYKPGVKMVKITTDPKVYAVDAHGTLRWVSSEAVAVALYGASWNQMIDDVPDAFFTNYTIGADVASASSFSPSGASSAATSINVDKNLGLAVSGSLTAMLNASQPVGGTLPMLANGVTMVKVDVKNNATSAITVDSVTVHRNGPGSTNDFAGIYVYEGNNRLTTSRTLNASTNDATVSGLNLALAAGETKTLIVVADFNGLLTAPAASAGDVNSLSITSITAGSSSASGLPVAGPSFTLAGVEVGAVTVSKNGTISNPKAGQLAAKVAEFKLDAGAVEDIMVNKVVLYYAGSVSRSNITNLVLKQAGSTVASVAGLNSKDQAVFVLATPFKIEKGNSRIFEVFADVAGLARAAEEVKFYVDQDADVLATGVTYGYGVQVDRGTIGTYDGTACVNAAGKCSYSKVEAGQLTITFNGPAAKDIAANSKDVELFNFTMAAQANLEVRKTRLVLTGVPAGSEAEVQDLKITDVATGAIVAGPVDGVNGTVNYDRTEVYNLMPGAARTFKVTADIKSTAVAGHKYTITLDIPTFVGNVRNLDNSTNLAAADFVPAAALAGNQHTIKKASATFSVSSTPVAQTFIQGVAGASMFGFSVKAGDASDIKVSSLKVTGSIDANNDGTYAVGTETAGGETATASDSVLTCNLWDGSTQVGATKSPGAGADGSMTFDSLNLTVGAGQTKALVMKCTLASSIASLALTPDRIKWAIALIGDVSVTDLDGNSIVAPDLTAFPVNGVAMTVKAAGTITVERAPSDVESEEGLVIGGGSNVVLAKYKLTAADEELKLTKASFNVTNADTVVSLSLYDGSTLVGGPASVDGAGDAFFTGLNFVVPKDGSKVLTVKGNLNSVGSSGALTGRNATVTLKDTAGAYVFEVRGTSAGSSTNLGAINPAGDKAGYTKIMRKTKPTISLVALPTTVLSAGDQVVMRFTVAADAGGDVALAQLSVDVAPSGTVAAALPAGPNVIKRVGGDWLAASTSAYVGTVLTIVLDAEETITAGTSKSFDVYMNLTGAVANDSVSSKLLGGDANATGTVAALAANMLIWSDMSQVGHNLAAGVDWASGYKVKSLPSDAQTLQK